jgi:hypothetical protein
MALSARSLFVYGIEVTTLNQNIDFKAASGGSEFTAVLDLGFYSPSGLADAVATAMNDADAANNYTCAVARNILGGTQNRLSISTTGTYLSLLFATGTNALISAATLMGFNPVDYTGSTTYSGSQTTGTSLVPEQLAYSYLSDMNQAKVFGAVNVAASGLKEAVTFNFQKFIDVQYKYEPKINLVAWKTFFLWAIQQRPFDFTPEISTPAVVYQVTLDRTEYDSKGLGYRMKEMLPNFPNFYETGPLMFRIIEEASQFTS